MKSAALWIALLLCSCGGMDGSERAARDRIMLVQQSPETLGYKRLVYQAASHPDLEKFLTTSGKPDFIAETSSDNRQYLILYYLDTGKAFACRTWRGRADGIEFAGPYSMTKKETEVLRQLKQQSGGTGEPGWGYPSGELR